MRRDQASGFSLIETMVAMGILATGLLGLAGMFTVGMAQMATSSANLIAREKAREAVESVHTARDTQTITWAQIRNDADGGVFVAGDQPIRNVGNDGLVNTADDSGVESLRQPGPNGVLGDGDDLIIPLTNYTRKVEIADYRDANNVVNANLRTITVTINYTVGPVRRSYVLTTYISRIS